MPTQLTHDRKAGTAWLEYYGPDSSAPEQTPLESFPFIIGRVDPADLTVDSSRVSREHAEITCQRTRYTLRDLGSTNGTFLNGKRIEEARLSDGDVIKFADVEFSFCSGQSQQSRTTATLRMSQSETDVAEGAVAPDLIRDIRCLHETLVHRAIDVLYLPIAQLDDQAVVGCEATLPATESLLPDELAGGDFRLVSRLRALTRLVAVEQAAHFDDEVKLFVTVDAADVGAAATNCWLTKLAATLGGDQLVVQIPHSAVCDIPYFREFLSLLRDARIGVAYDDIAAGAAQLLQNREIAPDYLKLAPSLARGISRNRNLRRNLHEIVDAAGELECDLIVAGVDGNESANVCRDLGCRLAQGEFVGNAQPAGQFSSVASDRRR